MVRSEFDEARRCNGTERGGEVQSFREPASSPSEEEGRVGGSKERLVAVEGGEERTDQVISSEETSNSDV